MSEQTRMPALVHGDALLAPMPGWFRRTIADHQPIGPGDIIGELDVLGRTTLVTAPDIRGIAQPEPPRGQRRAVGYGDGLMYIVESTTAHPSRTTPPNRAPKSPHDDDSLVFRAPTAGRFYARPSPDKPLFVTVGSELTSGTVVCLLEVMKTFSRITYTGAPARVRAVLVADGSDVRSGDPLLELEYTVIV